LVSIPNCPEIIPGQGERCLTFGGTRAGKSALDESRMGTIQVERPDCMILLIDTKPRFRAETKPMAYFPKRRKSAADLYETWAKGPVVPNSCVVDLRSDRPFNGLFRIPGEVAICQSGDASDWRHMLVLVDAFVRSQIKGRERLVIVDEALDFYQRNSWSISPTNDPFYRTARAGGERNIGLMLGAHQVAGIPPLILKMASRYTLFHLRDEKDMKRLHEVGIPDELSPVGNYVFKQWMVEPGGTISEPITATLDLPEEYLNQLADT
jgi:hypothetical protein